MDDKHRGRNIFRFLKKQNNMTLMIKTIFLIEIKLNFLKLSKK